MNDAKALLSHVQAFFENYLAAQRGLSSNTIGTLVLLLVPVELVLILVASLAFAQRWNVELEVPDEEAAARRRGGGTASPFGGRRAAAT